ncbi:MAG: hypothetical protein RMJ14_06420, partial [Nitrososphaerota archaeon]|nr:hypothetical protein [Nitrososphaerota archaeon]
MKFAVKLQFFEPLRATKPPADVELAKKHLEAMEGRVLEKLREEFAAGRRKRVEEEMDNWLQTILSVFPRKIYEYNGGEVLQIAFPSRWILGFLEERIKALKMNTVYTREFIYQNIQIRPALIG